MEITLRYLFYQIRLNKKNGAGYDQLKHYFKWKKSFEPGASSVRDELPWITFDAIDIIKSHLDKRSRIFEYGGGGSTLFFVKRAGFVHTVEHDAEWFGTLSRIIEERKYTNWDGSFVLPQKGDLVSLPDPANPEHFSSEDEKSKGYNYRDYVSVIDKFSDEYFDFVLIDGRSRPACIAHSIPKLKKGGILVLDNSDRAYYRNYFKTELENKFDVLLDKIGLCPYSKTLPQTSIWRKR